MAQYNIIAENEEYTVVSEYEAEYGKISTLPASGLAEALIPIPSLEEQEKIANNLDRFDVLVNDLTQGLPAEIAARRQQYEH